MQKYFPFLFFAVLFTGSCTDNSSTGPPGYSIIPKPPVLGMVWEDSIRIDSSFHSVDSNGVEVSVTVPWRIHRMSEISDSVEFGGRDFLTVHATDTVYTGNEVARIVEDEAYFQATDSAQYLAIPVDFAIPLLLSIIDTLMLKTLHLPLISGNNWEILNWEVDTAMQFLFDSVRFVIEAGGTGTVLGDSVVAYDTLAYICSKVELETNFNIYTFVQEEVTDTLKGDSLNPDTMVTVIIWDTTWTSKSNTQNFQFYNSDFSVSLYSHSTEQKETRNLNQNSLVTETIIRETWLKSFLYP